MRSCLYFLALLFAFTGAQLRAQSGKIAAGESKRDSISPPVDSSFFFAFSENGFPYGNFANSYLLTNYLTGFQDYHPRQANLGNYGSAEKNLALPQAPANAFRYRPNTFAYFGFLPENRTFYTSKRPYTKLQYIVGQKQEQNFKVIHAHPFGENCNIAFGFDRIRSAGFYQRQNTNNTSVNLSGWVRAPGRRYAALADFYWTGVQAAENGGIANDSAFEFDTQPDRKLISVNLSSAQTRQRLRGAWVKQYFSFGTITDTIPDLSDSTNIRTRIHPSWAIVNTLYFGDESYGYTDGLPASGFYPVIYEDSLATSDSAYLWRFQGGLWLERFDHEWLRKDEVRARRISGKLGAKFESGELKNDSIYTHFYNIFADGRAKLSFDKRWLNVLTAEGWYVVSGTNAGDLRANVLAGSKLYNKKIGYLLEASMSLLRPDFIFRHYTGNHLRWVNDFHQAGIHSASLTVFREDQPLIGERKNFFSLTGTFAQYTDPLYFDSLSFPNQHNGAVTAIAAEFRWLFGLDWLRTRGSATWNLIDKAAPIRLAEYVVRASVFGNFRLFKKALHLQIGVDATWISAYFADGYSPNIAQFFVQNTELIGNYVFLDPWLSIKVKPVRLFVKADHVNAGLMGRTYYMVPHYPQNDLALKFGASWVFND